MANRRARSAYYSEEEDRYSDDFDSEDERRSNTTNNNNDDKRRATPKSYLQDRLRGGKGRGVVAGGRGRGRGGRKGRGGGRGQNSRNSEPPDMTRRSYDTVTQRVLSASRNKVNEFRNQVAEMNLKMKELSEENKLYKKMQFRQEKALRTFEDKENDLPSILEKHANEIRTLKENNRRLREKYEKSDRYLRDAEDELERANKKVKKLREIVEEKDLKERDELTRKLTKAEIDMEERDVKIKELQRHIDVLKKNHRHELGIENARLRDMKRQVDELTDANNKLSTQLKDREHQLDKTNIYANRAHEEQLDSPMRRVKKKTSSLTDLTPRDKAKFYADKKREEFKKQKALKSDQEKKKREKWEQEEREKKKKIEEEEREREKKRVPSPSPKIEENEFDPQKVTDSFPPPEFSFKSLDQGLEKRERENRLRKEEEDRRWRERQEEERKQKEEVDRKRKDAGFIFLTQSDSPTFGSPKVTRELELQQEENRRREIEDQKRKEKEEAERKEREIKERKLREEREERENQERLRREKEKEEQDRRLEQERKKLENDPSIQEERKKKDELLRKLEAMDEMGSSGARSEQESNHVSPIRMTSNSRGGSFGSNSDKKEYSFTKPINNLHKGKPSHEDHSFKSPEKMRSRRVIASNENEDGGYNPSFGPARPNNRPSSTTKPLSIFDDDEPLMKLSDKKPEKKPSNLLENLFGPQAAARESPKKSRLEENETFFLTNQSPTGNKRGGANSTVTTFPWDGSPTKTVSNSSNIQSDTSLFGGGASISDSDFLPAGTRPLPRRQRQNNVNAFSAKPSVSAVDNFEDDIEEVVL